MKQILMIMLCVAVFSFRSSYALSQSLTDEELKYIAVKLSDPECIIGIFRVPAGTDQLHKLKTTGDYLESDSNYISLAINNTLVKLDVLKMLKGQADSCIIINMPMGGISEEGGLTFYSYPGTEWIMILNKGLINNGSKDQPAGWVQDIGDLSKYSWINPQTVFVANGYKGNYNLEWNKAYDMPDGLLRPGQAFADDLVMVKNGVGSISSELNKDDYNAKITELKSKATTADGKRLCDMLMK